MSKIRENIKQYLIYVVMIVIAAAITPLLFLSFMEILFDKKGLYLLVILIVLCIALYYLMRMMKNEYVNKILPIISIITGLCVFFGFIIYSPFMFFWGCALWLGAAGVVLLIFWLISGGRFKGDSGIIECEKCKGKGIVSEQEAKETICPLCNGKGIIVGKSLRE